MKSLSLLNSILLFFSLFLYGNNAFALNDYQIKEFCKKSILKSNCFKNLKNKRMNLKKGNRIKIPVIPFKKYKNF